MLRMANSPTRAAFFTAALLMLGMFILPAHAHERSTSFSSWQLASPPWQLTLRLSQYDLTRLQMHVAYQDDYAQRVSDYVAQRLLLTAAGEPCEYRSPSLLLGQDGWLNWRAEVVCPYDGRLLVESRLFEEVLSSHLHFVALITEEGSEEQVLTAHNRRLVVSQEGVQNHTFLDYLKLGVDHILTGWDHLLFLLGLLLLAGRISELAWLITGFTLAHSLTLGATVLGWLQPHGAAVETLIGLSLLLVAVEITWERQGRPGLLPACFLLFLLGMVLLPTPDIGTGALLGMGLFAACYFGLLQQSGQPQRWRLLLAMGFGLVHGVGFAGLLLEMQVPDGIMIPALAGFNLGVECGQLLVVAVAWPLLQCLRRWRGVPLPQMMTVVIAGFGSYWSLLRAMA